MIEKTFKSFAIIYEGLKEKETYSCGDVIKGQISFKLSERTQLCAIKIVLKGEAKVSWYEGSGENRRTCLASEEYFKIKEVLLGQDDNAVGDVVLQEGTHVYPFSVQLPQGNFPSSYKVFHGSVVYCLEVQMHQPERMPEKFQSELRFVSSMEAKSNDPQLLVSPTASSSKKVCCLCCASGLVSICIHLEKKGFVPGEVIKIAAEFENFSSRTLVPEAALAQIQTVYTYARKSKKRETTYLALVVGKHLAPHSSDVWDNQILEIPASTPPTLSNCQIIEVEYSVVVRLRIPWGINLKATIPLLICSTPT